MLRISQTLLFAIITFTFTGPLIAQEYGEEVELFIVESFIPPETPAQFHLAFYTTDFYKSKIVFEDSSETLINDTLSDNHKALINIAKVRADSGLIRYHFVLENGEGQQFNSETYDVRVPAEEKQAEQRGSNEFLSCIYGGIIYLIPVLDYNFSSDAGKFGLSKELPIISFYSGGFNYPAQYISAEYSYMVDGEPKNVLRAGWKYLHRIPVGIYLSGGLNGFTDFKGTNGICPEISWGLFSFKEVFTVFARYRFSTNFQKTNYSTISIGLASWFFSVQQ